MDERTRIVIYVPADLAHLVDETASALRQSRSALIRDILTDSTPVLEAMRDLARQLNDAPERTRATLEAFATEVRGLIATTESMADDLDQLIQDPLPLTGGSE